MPVIKETITHGDYKNVNTVEIEGAPTAADVAKLLSQSPWNSAAADNPAKVDRILKRLLAGNRAGHGWAWFTIEEN